MLAEQLPRESILVVEDEPELAQLLQLNFDPMGFDVEIAPRLDAARRALRQRDHALVILDLTLPDGDGLDLCRELRQAEDYTPILILTARSDETDRVVGLELGADDYLVKPFAVRELTARVRAIRRRVALSTQVRQAPDSRLVFDGLEVDPSSRRVLVAGQPAELTATEFDLLLHLASNPGRVYTRAQLLDRVWGDEYGTQEHAVNAGVNRLRAKIEIDPGEPRFVRTVWGVGYRFFDPKDES
ncbi:MAG: response regulator [Acidobacteria bacterium]|nr:response regulator [Acidobacteriota bacterium]